MSTGTQCWLDRWQICFFRRTLFFCSKSSIFWNVVLLPKPGLLFLSVDAIAGTVRQLEAPIIVCDIDMADWSWRLPCLREGTASSTSGVHYLTGELAGLLCS